MHRKTAHDFDQELLVLFDAYVHGAIDRRTFLDKAAKFAVGGVTAMMLLDQLSPNFAAAQVVSAEDERIEAKHLEYDSPKGYGKTRGYFVHPAGGERQAAGHPRDPREPRPQPAHRRHRTAPRPRRLRRVRPRRALSAGRLSRRRGQGARAVPEARPGQDPRRLHRRRRVPEGAPGVHGQDRRGRFLLRGRHGELPGHAPGRRSRRRRLLLRLRPGHGGRGEDQVPADGAVGRDRTSASTRAGRSSSRRSRRRTSSTSASSIPARSTASTTTRRRATMRRRPSSPGSGRSRSSRSTSARVAEQTMDPHEVSQEDRNFRSAFEACTVTPSQFTSRGSRAARVRLSRRVRRRVGRSEDA